MPKIVDQYPETNSMGSIGSIVLGLLEVQVGIQLGPTLSFLERQGDLTAVTPL